MKRQHLELLIVAPLALLLAGRGAIAILQQSMWEAGKTSPPQLLTGSTAQLAGLGYVGLGLLLFSAWVIGRPHWRGRGIALALVASLLTVAGFGGVII